jgi:hypothetical protein
MPVLLDGKALYMASDEAGGDQRRHALHSACPVLRHRGARKLGLHGLVRSHSDVPSRLLNLTDLSDH